MHTIREETGHPINKKNAQDLYSRYMTLALQVQAKGDRALFEDYYQRAEHYLYLMNELHNDLPVMPVRMAGSSKKGNLFSKSYVLRRNRRGVQGK